MHVSTNINVRYSQNIENIQFIFQLYSDLLAGDGLGPHGLGGGGGHVPQPGMGIFAMMATIGTVPIAHSNIMGELSRIVTW